MKKKLIICLFVIFTILMTGCTKSPELSEDESKVVAEYIAGMLIKHNKGYSENFIKMEKEEPEPTVEPLLPSTVTPDLDEEDNNSNTNVSKGDSKEEQYSENLSDIFSNKDYDFKYNSFAVYSGSYPENIAEAGTCVESTKGNKLLVVQFNIENKKAESQKINMTERKIDYKLVVNGSDEYGPLITLLDNDLRFYNDTIQGNSTNAAVIVYRIPKKVEIKTLQMYIGENDKKVYIKIK